MVGGGGKASLCPPPYKRLWNVATFRNDTFVSFSQITLKLGNFTNLKSSFQWCRQIFPNLFRNVKRKHFPLGDHYITSQSFFFLLIMYCYEKLMLKTFGTWGVNYIYIHFWWFSPRNVVQSTECPFKVINLANLHHKHLNQGVPKPISDCNNNNKKT